MYQASGRECPKVGGIALSSFGPGRIGFATTWEVSIEGWKIELKKSSPDLNFRNIKDGGSDSWGGKGFSWSWPQFPLNFTYPWPVHSGLALFKASGASPISSSWRRQRPAVRDSSIVSYCYWSTAKHLAKKCFLLCVFRKNKRLDMLVLQQRSHKIGIDAHQFYCLSSFPIRTFGLHSVRGEVWSGVWVLPTKWAYCTAWSVRAEQWSKSDRTGILKCFLLKIKLIYSVMVTSLIILTLLYCVFNYLSMYINITRLFRAYNLASFNHNLKPGSTPKKGFISQSHSAGEDAIL